MIGMRHLFHENIDLIVSGINRGPNIGVDIHSSGTVMATLPSHRLGIPSIAVSLYTKTREEELNFDFAAEVVENLALGIKNGNLKANAILNANVPNIPRKQIKGILITRASNSGYMKLFKVQGDKVVNYHLELDELFNDRAEKGTDIWAIHHGYVSITPLHFEVTHDKVIRSMEPCVKKMEKKLL